MHGAKSFERAYRARSFCVELPRNATAYQVVSTDLLPEKIMVMTSERTSINPCSPARLPRVSDDITLSRALPIPECNGREPHQYVMVTTAAECYTGSHGTGDGGQGI